MNIFRSIGCIGDSLSRGGLTACQLYREADMQTSPVADINRLFGPASAKQGYIIALGVNDLKGKDNLKNIYGGEVGNVQTDIDRVNYKNNKGTLMGGMPGSYKDCSPFSRTPNFF